MHDTETKIKCEDGVELAGTLFNPEEVKAAVLIGPATGIKRQFYTSFARHLCEKGYGVLTFDNRGIGQSKGKSVNDHNASLVNWGKLDLTAALEHLKRAFPNTSYHLVGHSAGGQLVGLMKNAKDLKSMVNFGSASGSLKHANYPFRLKSSFFLNIYIPTSNFLFGHTKSQWVGMGEPLPKQVSKQWRKWCNGTGYVNVDLNTKIKEHLYDELTFDTLWMHAKDDEIATLGAVKDMVRVYTKINSKIVTVLPKDFGFNDIGHMKFFSSRRKELWSLAVDWLDEKST